MCSLMRLKQPQTTFSQRVRVLDRQAERPDLGVSSGAEDGLAIEMGVELRLWAVWGTCPGNMDR